MDTISGWLDSKKVKFTPDKASVFVRLLEDQRLGMLPEPAGPNTSGVTFPPYVGEKLGPRSSRRLPGNPTPRLSRGGPRRRSGSRRTTP